MKYFLTKVAKKLRKARDPHEVTAWARLRNRQFLGLKFRRQYTIGPYVVHFCCLERQLIIELDGGGHDEPYQRQIDDERDAYLTSQGFRVVRIWTSEIEAGLEALCQDLQNQ